MNAFNSFEIPFQPTLAKGEGFKYLEPIYSLEDPDNWCLWQSTVLALEHFKGSDAWWPSQGLLAHQLEWRVARMLSIYGNTVPVAGHSVGLNVMEEHFREQGIVFASQHVIEPVAEKSSLDWHDYGPTVSEERLHTGLLPGIVQYTRPGRAHMEFFLDLSEKNRLLNIAKVGHEAVRVRKLSLKA